MTACATENTKAKTVLFGNLFLQIPDTDFSQYLTVLIELLKYAPEIIDSIVNDLDAHAKKKKSMRLADKEYFESQTPTLPTIELPENIVSADKLNLDVGRPRMSAFDVYIYLMLRAYLGSLSSKKATCFLRESMSLHIIFGNKKRPGTTTITENVNAVSYATRSLIEDKLIAYVLDEKLDTFDQLTIDSTAVKASSCWPTDSDMMNNLLIRAYNYGHKLQYFGLKDIKNGYCPQRLKAINKLVLTINMASGKGSKRKRTKAYRKLFKKVPLVINALEKELRIIEQILPDVELPPSRMNMLNHVIYMIRTDIADAGRVLEYAKDRIINGKITPSTEKVLSMADGSAAYIQKGGRTAVIGYKPQLVRSANGFVVSLIVPEGNASDSIELVPAIVDSIMRTGIIAQGVSTDDGYASKKGRDALLGMGVKQVSISGAKGKKLSGEDEWNHELFREARRNRSAVESLMFTIKDGFAFGEVRRRGIEQVRDELLEKVLAYNCCRIILLKQRREKERKKASA